MFLFGLSGFGMDMGWNEEVWGWYVIFNIMCFGLLKEWGWDEIMRGYGDGMRYGINKINVMSNLCLILLI